MILDKNRLFDGWLSLEGGVDAGRAPDMIEVNQCESALNMTFRGGSISTRPGWRKLEEEFPTAANQEYCFNNKHQYNPTASLFIYSSNHHTLEDPGTGKVRTNTGDPSSVTQIAISGTSNTGLDARAFFRALDTGNEVTIADQDDTDNYAWYFMTATPVDHGSWFLFYVTADTTGGTVPATAATVKVAFPDFGFAKDLFLQGEYKKPSTPLRNPEPPFQNISTWFLGQDSETIYKRGILQSAICYSPHQGEDCIMAMIGGRLFKIIPKVNSSKVTEIFVHGDENRNFRNQNNLPLAYMVQADKWLIVQDGSSLPIIYDNSKARRSRTTGTREETEIPVGTILAYGMGRIVTIVNDRDVAFGDIYGSHEGDDPADSLILFTERNFLAEGFDAAIPFQQGVVTGMMFFPQQDTSTGNGQLMVFAERGATSFFVSIPRDQWKTSAFQILSLLTTGLRGHRTISVVNEDLWFRSDDGVRSYRQARSDSERYSYNHIPLSTNVRQYTENDSRWLLKFASSMYFDNRILLTTSPVWNNGRPWHFGSVVVDFDILSSFSRKFNPAWEGKWQSTRFLPTQLLTGTFDGVTRAFAFGLNSAGDNCLFELSRNDKDDWDGERIPFEMVSRSFGFDKLSKESTPFTENELYDGDIWLRDIIE